MDAVMQAPAILDNVPTRAQIERLEATMLAMPQADCPVMHTFGPGLYVRQVTMKAGTYAIGHEQTKPHLNILLTGRVSMIEPDGSTVERSAPLVYVGHPGRKVGYVHEDVVWLNVYATNETDVEALEAIFLNKSAAFEAPRLTVSRTEDIEDFTAAIAELGISAERVRAQSENSDDQMPFPPGSYGVKVGQSGIEGRGLIATRDFAVGEFIAPARINGKRTPAGRYTNHAKNPNAKVVFVNDMVAVLVATRPIAGCSGGQDGEEITADYRQVHSVNVTHSCGVAA